MKVQVIQTSGGEEMVILPRVQYERLRDLAEDREDADVAKAVLRKIETGEEEVVPQAVAERLFNGENPIKVWREYRGMTQAQLAAKAKINLAYLWQIESGPRQGRGSITTLKAIARALRMDGQFLGLFNDKASTSKNR